jgi:hypothetical protein
VVRRGLRTTSPSYAGDLMHTAGACVAGGPGGRTGSASSVLAFRAASAIRISPLVIGPRKSGTVCRGCTFTSVIVFCFLLGPIDFVSRRLSKRPARTDVGPSSARLRKKNGRALSHDSAPFAHVGSSVRPRPSSCWVDGI